MFQLLLFLSLFSTVLFGGALNISSENQNILKGSSLYIDVENRSFEEIIKVDDFEPIEDEYINLGVLSDASVWIKFSLSNASQEYIQRYLEIVDLYPDSVTLYSESGELIKSDLLSDNGSLSTLNLSYSLIFAALSEQTYYMQVHNDKTMMRFSMNLQSSGHYVDQSVKDIIENIFLFGLIIALMFYNIVIYFHTRESMYLFYVLYIGSVVLQQLSYVSILPLLFSQEIVDIAHTTSLVQISLMYMSASLYSQSFLSTKNYPRINKIYYIFIALAIIEIPFFGTSLYYLPEVGLVTGLLFVFFNTFSGIYIYLDGNKQARLFALAWVMLVFAYSIIILDSLGLIAMMKDIPNLILYFTAIEALLLSLAFSDRYSLLREEKEDSDHKLLETLQAQKVLIDQEVEVKTQDLNLAVKKEKVLLKELHHRTKNNLQLILSLIRMQASHAEHYETKEQFNQLESRIAAISRTHEILYLKDDFESIDMQTYIETLCSQMQEGVLESLDFDLSITQVHMPIRESVYVGLIINELITNTIKYAKPEGSKKVEIVMHSEFGDYTLSVGDNGQGYCSDIKSPSGLGLSLVKTLVEDQLEGDIELNNKQGMSYLIKFSL